MKLKNSVLIFFCMAACCMHSPAHGAENAKSLKDSLRSIATEIIVTGKEAVSGLNEGVDQGLAGEAGAANIKTVNNKEEFASLLSARVIKTNSLGQNGYELVLAVKNDNSFPVRVAGLLDLENVVLLDAEGFSHLPGKNAEQPRGVICLSKSLTRLRFRFNDVESQPATLRFYGQELAAPEASGQ